MKCPSCKKTTIAPLQLGATIGRATQLKGCPECGVVFIELSTANNDSDLSVLIGEKTKEVFGKLDKLRGYRPPKRKAEAASIIRMLKTYTPDEIMTVWQQLKADKFWQNKELFMMTVESHIGAVIKNGTHKSNPRAIKRPEQYTDPDALRHG